MPLPVNILLHDQRKECRYLLELGFADFAILVCIERRQQAADNQTASPEHDRITCVLVFQSPRFL